MLRYFVLSVTLFLAIGVNAQFGQMDVLMHFHPAPGAPTPAWPEAQGADLLIYPVNGGLSEDYIAVGSTVEQINGYKRPILLIMDVGFGPAIMKRLDEQDFPDFTATSVCRSSNGDIFIGAITHNTNNTETKYLIKTDDLGAAQWALNLGEGNIKQLVYNQYDDRVLVYGEEERRIYLASFDPNTGGQDWAFTYTGNPVAPMYRAGALMIDPGDEQILMMNTQLTNGTDETPFVLKLDRLTGIPIWSRTYQSSGDASISGACYHNGSVTMAGIYNDQLVLTMNIDPSNGNLNWSTKHRSAGKKFATTAIDYNAGSDQLFVVGGVTGNSGYSEGFIMPVSSSGGNLIDFTAHSTAYYQGPFPFQADYAFNDIDVDFYSVNSDYEMILHGTGASNGTSSYNGGMWTMRTDKWGDNTQVCPQDIGYSTYIQNFTLGDGYKQFDGPDADIVDITSTDIIHNETHDCQYMSKQGDERTMSFDDEVLIYPNPASDWVNIAVNGNNTQVILSDAHGRTVRVEQLSEDGIQRLNVSDLSSGLYFIHQTTNGQTTVNKVMVR